MLDLDEKLIELIVKKSLEKNKVEEIIKKDSFTDEIIANADSFLKFKDKVKKTFSKDKYLEFLLSTKNPSILELKSSVDDSNKSTIYDFIKEKPKIVKELAKVIDDRALLFSVGVYEKDFDTIIANFDKFETATKEYYELLSQLGDVVDSLIKNRFKNEEIAKKLLNRHVGGEYNKKQIFYLANQINDYDFIKKIFNKDHIETDVVLLVRLAQLNKQKTFEFIRNKKDLLNRHWSYITPLFNFLKKNYDKKDIESYIKSNQDCFRTSSHLKKHLKEECGIFISQKVGILTVEIK